MGSSCNRSAAADAVVIGAGAAGLSAARALRRAGLNTPLLEAKSRIGGRAWTDTETFGVPLDWGCHWLHSAGINPFTRMADEWGFAYRTGTIRGGLYGKDGWDLPSEFEARQAFLRRNWEAIAQAGRAGRDVRALEVIERNHRWSPAMAWWVSVMTGLDARDVSTLDLQRYRDTGENWPLEAGYGTLVARYGAGLAVSLETVVRRVEWGGRRVRVHTNRGVLDAHAVVIAVSVGVLGAEAIVFDPPLPAWKQESLAAVPLGYANKIAFRLDGNPLDLPAHGHALSVRHAPQSIGFQIRPFGRDLLVGYVGGGFCRDLEAAGEAAMIDFGRERLAEMYGAGIARHVVDAACSAWTADPHVRGGYSCALPGMAERRAELAMPLDDRVFFAGEACHHEFFATAHGAHLSGLATARTALTALCGVEGRRGVGGGSSDPVAQRVPAKGEEKQS